MFEFEIGKEYPTKTVRQLINLFYRQHTFTEGGVKKASHPISLVSNPVPWVMPNDPFAQDIYLAIYHGLRRFEGSRYFVTVEQNIHQPYTGPHVAKLYIQVFPFRQGVNPARFEWLGTAQIACNFFMEQKLHAQLRKAIRLRKYFAGETHLEHIITFDEWKETTFALRA